MTNWNLHGEILDEHLPGFIILLPRKPVKFQDLDEFALVRIPNLH